MRSFFMILIPLIPLRWSCPEYRDRVPLLALLCNQYSDFAPLNTSAWQLQHNNEDDTYANYRSLTPASRFCSMAERNVISKCRRMHLLYISIYTTSASQQSEIYIFLHACSIETNMTVVLTAASHKRLISLRNLEIVKVMLRQNYLTSNPIHCALRSANQWTILAEQLEMTWIADNITTRIKINSYMSAGLSEPFVLVSSFLSLVAELPIRSTANSYWRAVEHECSIPIVWLSLASGCFISTSQF